MSSGLLTVLVLLFVLALVALAVVLVVVVLQRLLWVRTRAGAERIFDRSAQRPMR